MNSVMTSLCLVLAIYLGIVHSAQANTSFSTVNATSDTYRDFITTLRSNLTAKGTIMYDIPILRESVPDSEPDERFVLVDLSNTNYTITVAVDVVTLHVAGFSNGEYSYFLADAHPAALNYLFNNTTPFPQLRFGGSFSDLESAANQTREEISKGIIPLEEAITTLFNTTTDRASKATSLIVVIEMVVEAAKFKWIEQRFRDCIQIKCTLVTGTTAMSLEEKWSDLSFEIQSSYNGLFRTTIELENITGPWPVNNAWSNVAVGVSIQLFQCSPTSILRMPVDQHDFYGSTMCTPVASTTHISGANGLCVDVKDGNGSDGNVVQLWQCGEQSSQRWTFETNGTIHSLGKCLAINDDSNYVIITNCTTAISSAIKWALSSDGTISNPSSGLVLTAPTSTAGTNLTVETNAITPLQGWTVGEDVYARVSIIKGYGNNCWTSSGSSVALEGCILSKNDEQLWAFYNDGTIRLGCNRSLCVNSEGHKSGAIITLVQCKGTWSGQRWVFKADGTVLNPYANLVIDGIEQFVLSKSNGSITQQFLPYF